jgi:putative hemolysin
MAVPCTQLAPASEHVVRRLLTVSLAHSDDEVMECQRLRYRVFARELGASLSDDAGGLDRDRFDLYCKHLLVRDHNTGEAVATTRLMFDDGAMEAGMFYSETEFDVASILSLNGSIMEVGRTCIHPAYRKGSALAMLWHGVARMVDMHNVDYLIGCASIALSHGDSYVQSVLDQLRKRHFASPRLRVTPRCPLPKSDTPAREHVSLPTLLKGYLKQGALVCGEPHWDPAFNVADVFVLLDRDHLARRYVRHFMNRV